MTQAPSTPQPGTIVFVGAGPGNPDLLTVRAREVLSTTAIAVVDDEVSSGVREVVAERLPVPQDLLDAADEEYKRMCAEAKEAGARRKPARPAPPTAADVRPVAEGAVADVVTQLNEALSEAAELESSVESGPQVVRLVAGNPLTRESIKAEIEAVAAAGLEFQVVPGMSLPSTVPSFAGIALGSTFTEADVTDLKNRDVDFAQLAAAPQPLVLQATAEELGTIAEKLQAEGIDAATPASVTVNGTTRLQRTYDTTLGTLGKINAELDGQLVVTLGTSVDERTKYSWWENRPLYGWRVLVPRPKNQAASMSARLATHGAIPQSVPTISVEPPRNPAQMDRAIKGIIEGRYQWIVFTSVNAVNAVWDKIDALGLDARSFAGVHLAAVGTKTAAAIKERGLAPELLPPRTKQNAAGLVEVFPNYVEEIDPVSRVLLPRADIATDVLVDGLTDLDWEVDDIVAYRTVRASPPPAETRDMIKSGGFDAVCFTSSSTVKNLVGIAGKPHQRTIIACIGPMAAATAEEMGLRVDVVPEIADVEHLVDALADHVAHLRAVGQLPPPRKKRRSRRKSSQSSSATRKSKSA
ncbi:bifunctional uroporphyrinogen-III C-methyltransferase/uroporphyrinogen-III synthase [Corynebacterium yudongzhengii]|uniref:uroporphyrinogen-III C-methyltransferase n=1 Tax=Corynebacterium yudongzhengii TaxID=2080740 RepID=A0A2U1T9N0_9CORY|nr:uroporphyrinogen-III synthase [Corynebacterium yudongzhengii]AWB81164.1 bifunctional uroporphyrinogen-III C-methyltransferase/uroporphyrinogen-III synthase [Corynebacterium yudongzhengii]PWC02703.1 bifunctional uroporphyrinogen-III C-methyltransferase/uroporphyrinogen-III synthase [Corynebacterium yudongzhengii]